MTDLFFYTTLVIFTMNKRKALTLILLSLVLALVGSIIIVSGMLDESGDSALTFMQDENEADAEVLGFRSTTEDDDDVLIEEDPIEDEPIQDEPIQLEPTEAETKESIFDTFVPDQPTEAPPQPTAVEEMPQAGILDDYSKYFLILAPILIFGALLL